ncbi:MAG TPA: hypothetical protein VGU68_19450 [Ktedonobacteraceae bacterium]|nr:hypothetical protein [Ktedonobacteraceae bacterium]
MAVIRDPKAIKEAVAFFTDEIERLAARQALSKRFNPNHNDWAARTEIEKVVGAKTLRMHAAGALDIPDAIEGPPISPEERARRDAYREHLPNGRLHRRDE